MMFSSYHSRTCRFLLLVLACISYFEANASASTGNGYLSGRSSIERDTLSRRNPRDLRPRTELVQRREAHSQDAVEKRGMFGPYAYGKAESSSVSNIQAVKDECPFTGVTRQYTFNVSHQVIAPDGVPRDAVTINGQFPGPQIEADYGDWIEVTVNNQLGDDGTSLHWHGLLQKQTPWMDGTPSIQQCPIAPGKSFTYRFRADQPGTTWWHSHFSAQYTAGAFGALIIHGENEEQVGGYDEDLGPVFVHDWYYEDLFHALNTTLHSPFQQPPASDNVLINGKMNANCSANGTIGLECTPNAGLSKFNFTPGKKYRLRLINSGAAANIKFSIDGHSFTVIAQDFTPLVPYTTDLITLGIGQRTDVIVEAVGKAGDAYWMRADLGPNLGQNPAVCNGGGTAETRTGVASVFYEGADESITPTTLTSVNPTRLYSCASDPLNQTVPAEVISADPQGLLTTITMSTTFQNVSGPTGFDNWWTVDGKHYQANYSRSLMQDAIAGDLSEPDDTLMLYDFGSNGTIRLVIYHYFAFTFHPMHLHGHNFQILAQGWGTWDGQITNPDNPARRDVHILDKAHLNFTTGVLTPSYMVIQFFADNPGVWPFHCHLAWHNSAGLFVNLLTRPDDMKLYDVPKTIDQTCTDWNDWDANGQYVQLDSN